MIGATELADFMEVVRARGGPVRALDCGSSVALVNTLSCPEDHAVELGKLAGRPLAGMRLYKFGSRSIVGSYVLEDGEEVVLKYYYPKYVYKHFTHGMFGSRCMRSWLSALAFQRLGIPTPAPLMLVERLRLGGMWLEKSFLATGQAKGVTLKDWVEAHGEDGERLVRMAGRLGKWFGLMGRFRIAHGDLKATNLIVDENDEVSFVDLDAVEVLAAVGKWEALRERDVRIFQGNWKRRPQIAAAFSGVFNSTGE